MRSPFYGHIDQIPFPNHVLWSPSIFHGIWCVPPPFRLFWAQKHSPPPCWVTFFIKRVKTHWYWLMGFVKPDVAVKAQYFFKDTRNTCRTNIKRFQKRLSKPKSSIWIIKILICFLKSQTFILLVPVANKILSFRGMTPLKIKTISPPDPTAALRSDMIGLYYIFTLK